ncbi:MAG: hypothetical protein COY38_03120 [Candidatus Aenigmarchaeota archaeon CG_4_10_14_0_8_um_filter_37_24]|nr:hypothetical protein [Candidatus Aenigmarchaeota archaeon]OIN87142.1 MAG: hypothetical protein AUJ50_03140 [Candidatus Aenigmarchaeota archaeon CG1_02_38_14]PIV68205.1 MAG: hypothetical protein COS07_04780 [Candidatus Aenigmarchaeota archaeon CG01_land_8_20_14_3_00_37_9]PIW41546.1 MAG: hypothetical protein COW21_01470 [Candidatus Aenigmarchaeota archaeon CG15_BIG_FIL_POST_REV_8_21_14_020_37_27]PIX51091.1 MAG: hypothetical protein COZ52_00820 [Candidatus Aenigmarchaeota archaeon CG_4_8_14_3_u
MNIPNKIRATPKGTPINPKNGINNEKNAPMPKIIDIMPMSFPKRNLKPSNPAITLNQTGIETALELGMIDGENATARNTIPTRALTR